MTCHVCYSASSLRSSSGKSTLSLVTFAKYEWFEEWKDGKVSNRGAEYNGLKQAFMDSILEVVMDVFPKISREKVTPVSAPRTRLDARLSVRPLQVEYMDAGTPVTNTHYIGAPRGEIYGADHGTARFSPELNATVRPQTPLKNLYLTGWWSAPRRLRCVRVGGSCCAGLCRRPGCVSVRLRRRPGRSAHLWLGHPQPQPSPGRHQPGQETQTDGR